MPPRKSSKKTSENKSDFNIFGLFTKSFFAIIFIMIGGLLFNLDRMGDSGILLLKYKALLPSYVVRFLPGGTAASGKAEANQELVGKAIEVYDGDTITLLTSKNIKYRIRFYGIDAPEAAQKFGTASREALREKILGKDVTVQVMAIDRYQRAVGKVMLGSRHINLEMVKEGMAWYYSAYAPRRFEYSEAEYNAKKNRIGLWQEKDPKPPWTWRKENKK